MACTTFQTFTALHLFCGIGGGAIGFPSAQGRFQELHGNMVPVQAAAAIAEQMLQTLLAAQAGATFTLGSTEVWVEEREEAPTSCPAT